MKQTVIEVQEYDGVQDEGYPPRDLAGFIKWAQTARDQIPEGCRDSATIDIIGWADNDDNAQVIIRVEYEQPEEPPR